MNIEYSDSISGKVFTKDDVLRLIELCSKNIAKRKKEDVYNSEYFDVSLRSKDRLSYQFNAYDAKEIEPVLETKKIVQVSITFRNLDTDSNLIIKLDESKYGLNFYDVSSNNHEWFHAKKSELQEYFLTVKDQTNFYIKYRRPIYHVLALYFGYLILLLISAGFTLVYSLSDVEPPVVEPNSRKSKINETIRIPLTLILSYLVGLIPSDMIRDKLNSLWPNIEFNFGPEHLNNPKRRRKTLNYIVTIIVIPLVLSLLLPILA